MRGEGVGGPNSDEGTDTPVHSKDLNLRYIEVEKLVRVEAGAGHAHTRPAAIQPIRTQNYIFLAFSQPIRIQNNILWAFSQPIRTQDNILWAFSQPIRTQNNILGAFSQPIK
jgi:hypothetical protein